MSDTRHFLKSNQKTLLQTALGLFFLGLGIYFLRHEQTEVRQVVAVLGHADVRWVLSGVLLLTLFVAVQGLMYVYSFRAIGQRIGLGTASALYLKRNLISVFLPAGLLTNLFFFNEELERNEGVTQTQAYFASSIFSVCSILSSIIAGLPALFWLALKSHLSGEMAVGILLTVASFAGLFFGVKSLMKKRVVYRFLQKHAPPFAQVIDQLVSHAFQARAFWTVAALSCVIEIIGILHLYISMAALGNGAALSAAVIGYAIVLVLLMSSPFLRGVGVIEAALTYALTQFGFPTVQAVSVAMLFRFFEFWSLLVLGAVVFIVQRGRLFVRVFPALLLFGLGLVNILSAITPAAPERLRLLKEYLPIEAVHASTYFVLFSGVLMLGVGAYLVRGLRNAWWMAVVLSALSLLTHLTKGIDYEEATLALVVLASLLYERKQYFIKSDLQLAKRSLFPGLVAVGGVLLFGTLGFFFLDEKHFGSGFNGWQSFQDAVSTFFLINMDLTPATTFGKEFLYAMNILGGAAMSYLGFLLLRPLVLRPPTVDDDRLRAKALVEKYGRSPLDYFKTYFDKNFWFSEDGEGFVAFKTSHSYAIALEAPVCRDEAAMVGIIPAFERWSRQNGLRPAWYRIAESSKTVFEKLGKKLLPIGEDATVNLDTFSMQGSEKKALRNALNKVAKDGLSFHAYDPPQREGFLQQLKAVSDEWLRGMGRGELVFSQGLFEEKELKTQPIFTLENLEGRIVGFVNIIPCYAPGEANFDLMRKTNDAPNGAMDFLFVNMFETLKKKGFRRCNLGMVPMSGIDDPDNIQERIIKLAYERMGQFSHYKSLRFFKEKFVPQWQMMYMAYSAPFDLAYLPGALERVMEP
ncbi:MAG: lysylphosphatidylglycerol synthetase family protein [Saprospiraceae bacterium]|nr:MAG: lysylphosphatidylglycerol synthetase family protein [Saprospiraceae bacterium]